MTLVMLGWVRRAERVSASPASAARASDVSLRIQLGDRSRTAILVVPDGVPPAKGWPVVLALHGAGGSAEQMLRTTGWREVARRERFVLVGADGTPADETRRARFVGNMRTWNSGVGAGLSTGENTAFAKRIDDVGFLLALLDTVSARTRVDPKRVFVAGHSNGAGMSYRVAAEHPDRFAAIGVMAGHLFDDAPRTLSVPVPLVQIVGDRDPLVPMNGGPVRMGRGATVTLRPALDSPARWAAMNRLPGAATILRDDSVTVRQWGAATDRVVVRSYVVKGHGHTWLWPNSGERLPERLVGPTRQSLNATETMWSFFAGQR
jgi:polyhydroxybutyrate depolymerase